MEFCVVVTLNIPHQSTATGHNHRKDCTYTLYCTKLLDKPVEVNNTWIFVFFCIS